VYTHLEVGECGVQPDAPVHKPVRTVENPILMQAAKGLHDGFGEVLRCCEYASERRVCMSEHTSSIVNAERDQSYDPPRRRSWSVMRDW
jgi:hypothetical protein